MNLWRLCFGTRGAVIFDCLAVLAATHPHLLHRERRFVTITRERRSRVADNPRDVHLLASVEPGGHHGREVVFCREPLPGARAVVMERLLARPSPVPP